MIWHLKHSIAVFGTAAAIVGAVAFVYFPYIDNAPIFDDTGFFFSGAVFRYASTPFDLHPRTFPYFTFAFVQTITQSFPAQRVVNFSIHAANCILLYRLLPRIQKHSGGEEHISSEMAAVLSALIFAVHPVATYAVGYLVQRTTLLAVFFLLCALHSLVESTRKVGYRSVIIAAGFFSASVMSKEHAILFPLAAIPFFFGEHDPPRNRDAQKKIVVFLCCCFPAALLAVLSRSEIVGTLYEIQAPIFLPVDGPMHPAGLWLNSVIQQTWLFFEYFRLWLTADVSGMSIDLRPPPLSQPPSSLWALGFLAITFGAATALFRCRRPWAKVAAIGILFSCVTFAVEFSSIRIQEPFVLYRSYLWAPGYLITAYAFLRRVPPIGLLVSTAVAIPVLITASSNRLQSMENPCSVWRDAASKLASDGRPGAYRIYYNRASSCMRRVLLDVTLEDMRKVAILAPDFPGGHHGVALASFKQGKFEEAEISVDKALKRAPAVPDYLELKGKILLATGRWQEAQGYFDRVDKMRSLAGALRNASPPTVSTENHAKTE